MATLLGKTSLRIAKLPATGTSQKRKITYPGKSPSTKNAVKRQRPESDAGDDRDKEQDKEGLRWGMNALLGTSKRSKGSWLAQNVGRWWKSKNGPSLGRQSLNSLSQLGATSFTATELDESTEETIHGI